MGGTSDDMTPAEAREIWLATLVAATDDERRDLEGAWRDVVAAWEAVRNLGENDGLHLPDDAPSGPQFPRWLGWVDSAAELARQWGQDEYEFTLLQDTARDYCLRAKAITRKALVVAGIVPEGAVR